MTVRAEVSRMRKQFVGLLAAQPYRVAHSVRLEVQYPTDMTRLLPTSSAPVVNTARIELAKTQPRQGENA